MAENETTIGWIVFEAVEIDCAGRRLFVAGSEVSLEPKAFAVLVLLARHPGKAFSRDEILDAVWGHRHVTPGVLNRVITLIRQALGESADEHRYLHTLHGIGYRFDADVRELAARAGTGARAENLVDPASPAAHVDMPATDVAARVDETPQSTSLAAVPSAMGDIAMPSVVAAAAVAKPVEIASPSRRHAGRWLGFGAALLAIAAAIAYFGLWHTASKPSAPAVVSPTLVVLPLHPVGGTPDDTVLAEGLSEELITRLAHIEGLRLISRTSAERAQEDKLDLNQLSERLHVTHALEGSLRQSGDQLRIDLRLIDIPAGRTLWAQDYDRKLADVFAIQRDIAQAVAGVLALRLGLNETDPGDTDPQLFRDYLEARRLVQTPLDRNRGIEMLHAIIAKAPGYARAHASLARLLVSNLRGTPITVAELDEGRRETVRANELDPSLAETQTALAILACREADWTRCMDLFRRALTLEPAESDCRTLYAYWLAGIGYVDAALREAEVGLSSDPLNLNARFVRARLLDTMGRHEEALQYIDSKPVRAGTVYSRWYNAIWRRDFAAARDLAAAMPAAEGFRDSYVAATEALADPTQWPQVLPRIEASEQVTGRFNILRLESPYKDYPVAIDALEKMLRDGWPSYYLLLWMPEQSALRRDPAFQDFLKRTHILDYWRSHGWPPQCKPEGDGARCD